MVKVIRRGRNINAFQCVLVVQQIGSVVRGRSEVWLLVLVWWYSAVDFSSDEEVYIMIAALAYKLGEQKKTEVG